MHNNLEYISIMRYNKKRKYRIFGDGCNSLPAVIVTDYLAGWSVIELEQFSNMLQVIETAYIAIDKSEHKPASHWHDSVRIRSRQYSLDERRMRRMRFLQTYC